MPTSRSPALLLALALALVTTRASAEGETPAPAPPSASPATRVGTEVGYGSSASSAGTTSRFLYERASATHEVAKGVELTVGGRVTEDLAQRAVGTSPYHTGSDVIVALTGLANIELSDRWALGFGGLFSPTSTRDIATSIAGARGTSDALVRTRSNSAGGVAEVSYDSFDDAAAHDVDVEVVLGLGATRFGSEQTVVAGASSAAAPSGTASLFQGRATAATTLTFFEHTDVGLEGSAYVYDAADPGSVGSFDVTSRGATTSFGTGLPMLPARWSVHPEVAERIGRVTLRGGYQLTALAVDGSGLSHALDARVQVALSSVKLHVSAAARRDALDATTTADTWLLAAGASFRF